VGFSSVGPTADKRLKPDLAAMGKNAALIDKNGTIYEGNGTSYACPIVSGTFAQLMQLAPNAGSIKLKEALRLSSLTFFEPDKYIGAGVPNVKLAAKMVQAIGDTIIDIETAEDGKHLLIALNTRRAQKVELKIIHSIGGELSNETVMLQKGLNRVAIKVNKKRPKGLCRLVVSFGQRISEITFIL
jgi:hypothetical protein